MTARTGRSWGARAIRPFTTSFTRPSPPSAMTQPTSGPSSRASDSPWPAQAVVSIPKRPSPTRSRRSRAASEAATAPRPLFDTGFAMRTILPSSMEGTTTSLLTKQPTQRRPSDQPSADLRISRCTLNKATRSFPERLAERSPRISPILPEMMPSPHPGGSAVRNSFSDTVLENWGQMPLRPRNGRWAKNASAILSLKWQKNAS